MATRRGVTKIILMILVVPLIVVSAVNAADVIFTEDFESAWGDWYADNGVWEIGMPTSGPGSGHLSDNCAATILSGNYPVNTDSRLIYNLPHLDGICLPTITDDEEIILRFWHWYSYGDDAGYVQISVKDELTGAWSAFANIPAVTPTIYSSIWTLKGIDITQYSGKCVKIAFYHTADNYYQYPGWYVDDIEIIKRIPEFPELESFEDGIGDWSAESGVWQIGSPTGGPNAASTGIQCAGTVLDGNYPTDTDSRLVSPSFHVPEAIGDEEIHFIYWQWFSYGDDYGVLQISVQEEPGIWSPWSNVPTSSYLYKSSDWTKKSVDITSYSGLKVRLAFFHNADNYYEYPGWYIDDIAIVRKVPEVSVDFEYGWGEWSADNGVWEICTDSNDNQYAVTVCESNYPVNTDSRLISPTIYVCPTVVSPYMSFKHYWSYGDDYGKLQISEKDETTGEWSAWEDLFSIPSTIQGTSGVWTTGYGYLNGYEGKSVRIAFYHIADDYYEYPGWYIDDIDFPNFSPVIETRTYDQQVPPGGMSLITLTANDPCGGGLTYKWEALDGGTIIGSGAQVQFQTPIEDRFCPYRVRVSVVSEMSHIASPTEIFLIYTRCPGDGNEDGVTNIIDKVLVRNAFGTECGDLYFDDRADVNCDCVVNIIDKVIVRNSFGCSQ